MNKFESIDDFLSDRLSEQDKAAFEQKAASDPSLQADLELQRHIIDGVKAARRLELKTMLANVPVGGGSFGAGSVAVKIAASVLCIAVVGSVVYLAIPRPTSAKITVAPVVAASPENKNTVPAKVDSNMKATAPNSAARPGAENNVSLPEKKKEPSATAEKKKQPTIEVVDPSDEMVDSKGTEPSTLATHKASPASRIAVDTDASNKKYNFHYQFAGGKLMLYGPFDKSLYEILEINGDQKSVFLFYKGNYYLLSDKQNSITPLDPIRDPVLVKKLKEYRGQ